MPISTITRRIQKEAIRFALVNSASETMDNPAEMITVLKKIIRIQAVFFDLPGLAFFFGRLVMSDFKRDLQESIK